MHQPPVPEVRQEGGQTPVVRMNDGDQADFDLSGAKESQDGSQASNDVESMCLRTKDSHHLKLPQLPESASQYRPWRNSVRTMLLSYDQSQEGLLHQWLTPAFTARGDESDLLRTDSGDFPRLDRVLASVLCRQDTLRTALGLRTQSYVETCEGTGHQIRGRCILNLVAKEYDDAETCHHVELGIVPAPGSSRFSFETMEGQICLHSTPIAVSPKTKRRIDVSMDLQHVETTPTHEKGHGSLS